MTGREVKQGRMEVPNAVLFAQVRDALSSGCTATINVKGYSMRPFLEHCRDRVTLAPVVQLAVGDAVLAEVSKDFYVLHRIIHIGGEHLTLMGDGNLKGVEHCRIGDVVGVVVQYHYPHRIVKADAPGLRRRIKVWRRLLPVRRYLLFMYKVKLKISDFLK